jgi:hypothetical protein
MDPRHRAPLAVRPRGPAPLGTACRLTPQSLATTRHMPPDPAEPCHSALRAAQHRGPAPPSTGEGGKEAVICFRERKGGDGEREWRAAPVQENGDRREEGVVD